MMGHAMLRKQSTANGIMDVALNLTPTLRDEEGPHRLWGWKTTVKQEMGRYLRVKRQRPPLKSLPTLGRPSSSLKFSFIKTKRERKKDNLKTHHPRQPHPIKQNLKRPKHHAHYARQPSLKKNKRKKPAQPLPQWHSLPWEVRARLVPEYQECAILRFYVA